MKRLTVVFVYSAFFACNTGPSAEQICKENVTEGLLSPASAKFLEVKSDVDVLARSDGATIVTIEGKLDAANSYWQHSEIDPPQQSEIDPPPASLCVGAVGA